jgi:tRNA(His) 5'-end guanylyltransferase
MANKTKSIGDRMKAYEACYDIRVPARTYVMIRLDGKGFSKYTKMFEKPFDRTLSHVMDFATIELCKYMNPKFAYTQSDEISLMFTDLENIDSELIFDGKVQKLCSISASKITQAFNKKMLQILTFKMEESVLIDKIRTGDLPEIDAVFDARVYIIPDFREVSNYFIWRQQDCTRNSISMAASANFSHKLLEGKSSSEKQEMLFQEKNINWNDYETKFKRGSIIKKFPIQVEIKENPKGEIGVGGYATRNKWLPDARTPVFTQDKQYLYDLIPTIEI